MRRSCRWYSTLPLLSGWACLPTTISVGDEVFQLYVRHPDAPVPRPIRELKGFKRITLQPGERKRVAFTMDTKLLGYYDEAMRYVIVPGVIEVMVGDSSEHLPLTGQFEIVGQAAEVGDDKEFACQVRVE